MKVKELIEHLSHFDPEFELCINDTFGSYASVYEVCAAEWDSEEGHKKAVDLICGAYNSNDYLITTKLNKNMNKKYNCGNILFDDSTKTPFIYDGNITADGLGVVIGFTMKKGKLVLCRTSGKGNFQKDPSAVTRNATLEERIWFMNQIAIAKDIPFYSCI